MLERSRTVAMTAHLTGSVAAFFLPGFGWIGPALIWLLNQGDRDVVHHAREAFRFQLTMGGIAWLIGLVGAGLSCFLFGPVLWIAALVPWAAAVACGVMAGLATSNRDRYAYPLTGGEL